MRTPDTCIFFICYIFTDMNIQKVQVTTFSIPPPQRTFQKLKMHFSTFSRVEYDHVNVGLSFTCVSHAESSDISVISVVVQMNDQNTFRVFCFY